MRSLLFKKGALLKGGILTLVVLGVVIQRSDLLDLSFSMKNMLEKNQPSNLKIKQINVLIPFNFILPVNPRSVFSVGDQVLSEHIFSYHSRESIKQGFGPVTSNVDFDLKNSKIIITPRFNLKRSDGSHVSNQDICNSLKLSLQGTYHIPYTSLVKKIECQQNKIEIDFKVIPANMKFLFTVPDLSISDQKYLPIDKGHLSPTTGPYSIEKIEPNSVNLKRNKYYPEELVANKIENVLIKAYSIGDADQIIKEVHPSKEHIIYFDGYSLDKEKLDILKNKGYKIQEFPSEWLLFASLKDSIGKDDKALLTFELDKIKQEIMKSIPLGQEAFSIAPFDRPFGHTEHDYKEIREKIKIPNKNLARKIRLSATDSFARIPVYKELLHRLSLLPLNLDIKIYPRNEYLKMTEEADVYLDIIGISQADPLGHLSFLASIGKEYSSRISTEDISQTAMQNDLSLFSKAAKELESRLIKDMVIVPFGHFPGIVAEAPNFIRDESLAWGWGIQAWTYQVK